MSFGAHVPKPGEIARYLSLHSPGLPGSVANGVTIPVSVIVSISGSQYSLTYILPGVAAMPVGEGAKVKNVGVAAEKRPAAAINITINRLIVGLGFIVVLFWGYFGFCSVG